MSAGDASAAATFVAEHSVGFQRTIADYLAAQPVRGNATDAVTDALREAILDGTLPSATWLREEDLARALSVSRTPIREAFRRLADEGLTYRVANRGSIVSPMTLDEILAVYSVRESLEALAARTVALRRPLGAIDRLANVQSGLVRAAQTQDIQELVKLNLAFHRLLREMTENPYLDRFLLQVERAVRRFGRSSFEVPRRVDRVIFEHQQIIDAIAAGDASAAEHAALEHMRNARRARVQTLMPS